MKAPENFVYACFKKCAVLEKLGPGTLQRNIFDYDMKRRYPDLREGDVFRLRPVGTYYALIRIARQKPVKLLK